MNISKASILLLLTISFLASCTEDPAPEHLAPKQLLDESYGTHQQQKMDVFLPGGRSSSITPLLIYIHGGAWIDGDKSEFLQIKSILEKEFPDYAFVSLNYRLFDFATGENDISRQEQDIISAMEFIESQTNEWGISSQTVIAGASAGGHLALLHAFKNNTSHLKAAVAFFPPTDLTQLHAFSPITSLTLNALVGGTPSSAGAAYRALSPVNFVDDRDVPTIFFHGDLDAVVPIAQSRLLEETLKAAGVRHHFGIVPGQGHGFTPQTYAELFGQVRDFIDGL